MKQTARVSEVMIHDGLNFGKLFVRQPLLFVSSSRLSNVTEISAGVTKTSQRSQLLLFHFFQIVNFEF